MDLVEKRRAIEFTTNLLSNRKIKDDERTEQIIVYFNSIVLKYKRLEYFDEIEATSGKNLHLLKLRGSYATSWCCAPCVCFMNLFKVMVALMFFIATGLGTIYILYYFGSRVF